MDLDLSNCNLKEFLSFEALYKKAAADINKV